MLKRYVLLTLIFASFSFLKTTPSFAEDTVEVDNTTTTVTETQKELKKPTRTQNLGMVKEDRKSRLEAEKLIRLQNIEELKAKQEQFKQERETLKTKFDELKLQKLENIKQRGLLVTARYSAVSQAMYKMLERVTIIVSEKKDAGFDVSSAESSLTSIEQKLKNIKTQQDQIQLLIDAIQGLSIDQIPSALTEIKNISLSIKSQYQTVRTDMKQLVQSLK